MNNSGLFEFLESSPTAFHAVENIAEILDENGFTRLYEENIWNDKSGKYYVVRNGSSIIAFIMPEHFSAFSVIASHTDSPCFKIKPNAVKGDGVYAVLNTEKYGGMIYSSWLDRPLSVAGRTVRSENGRITVQTVDAGRDLCVIPNVAPHMDAGINNGKVYDLKTDMFPLFGKSGDAISDVFDTENALSYDLYLYSRQKPTYIGAKNEYIMSPRLDNLMCAYSTLIGFTESAPDDRCAVYCAFDNEETGSLSRQGADSDFISAVLSRLCRDNAESIIASSFLVSADNAHAVHPNHPELSDKDNRPEMNGGVVIKYNAAQHYTTDAVTAAIFSEICKKADVPCQIFANRSDLRGGSTLGSIALSHMSMRAVDIGLAQLAMHSACETAGAYDAQYLAKASCAFYNTQIISEKDGITVK